MTSLALAVNPNQPRLIGDTLKRFEDAGIQSLINHAMVTIPTDKNVVITAFANNEHAGFAIMSRIGDSFSVAGVLDRNSNGNIDWEVFGKLEL